MHDRSNQGHEDNRLLAALPRETLDLMHSELRSISLAQGADLYQPGAPIEQIYFPQSGMISLLVVTEDGRGVEVSTVGREGAVGLHGAFGAPLSFTRATAQIGGKFSAIRASSFARLVLDRAPVRDFIGRYTATLWAEAQQIAACNAVHGAAPRLCRWLLQSADHIGSDELPLTQELLAEMLSVRRTTVTILAQSLQRGGAIKYSRGHIKILDREKLRHAACECYAVIRQQRLSLKFAAKIDTAAGR